MMHWLSRSLLTGMLACAGLAMAATAAAPSGGMPSVMSTGGAIRSGGAAGMGAMMPGGALQGQQMPGGLQVQGGGQGMPGAAPQDSAITQITNEGEVRQAPDQPQDSRTDVVLHGADEDVPTEFQGHVAASVGRILPLFGHGLFGKGANTFAPVSQVPVTPDYMIGPGDQLIIRAWGQLDVNYTAEVDRNGLIFLPKVGNINVAGVRYQDLSAYVRTAVGRNFRNFDLNVTLGQLRSVPIFVVGHAKRPGSYTVSSLSTLVSALFASGGPSKTGSLRGIQLRRGSRIVVEFDAYDLLLRGDKSRDVTLQSGDVIYIPPVSRQVAMFGSVNLPAIYEIKPGETIESLVALAGGLTVTASAQSARIERIDDRRSLRVIDLLLDRAGLATPIQAGDIVSIFSISPRFDNAITLRGNVAAPGRYPWSKGMRIRDIIPNADALITTDYWMRRNRSEDVSITTEKGFQRDLQATRTDINWDYAVIERLDPIDASTKLLSFNLGKAVLEGDVNENLVLQPGDVVTIFGLDDLKVAESKKVRLVRLEGEFNQSGIFQVKQGETLRQLVASAGGLTPQSYLFGAQFYRESVRKLQQRQLDEFADKLEQDVERQAAEAQASSLAAEDSTRVAADLQAKKRLIQKMRSVKATGRVVLELPPDASSAVQLPDLVLEDGDRFIVPQRSSVVNVLGAVYNESAYLYRSEKSVRDYLRQAGGTTRDADGDSIYVMRADGSVLSAQQLGWLSSLERVKPMPGETIVVPVELDKSSFMRSLKDWTQILYQFGLGAAAVATLKGL